MIEEATVDPNAMEYIGSTVIPDWRYNTSDRGVMTAFFGTTVMSMGAKGADDIGEVKWFKMTELTAGQIVDTHQVLFALLKPWHAAKLVHLSARGVKPTIYGHD